MMGMTEEYFWNSTPRKIISLINEKRKIDKVNQKNLAIYIACYVWRKEPDDFEDTDDGKRKPIPGIDIPADDSLINQLL